MKYESHNLSIDIKILIISWNKLDICNAFGAQLHIHIQELNIASNINAGYISLYVHHYLLNIFIKNRYLKLASDSPKERIALLAKHACRLFVWAFNTTIFIKDGHDSNNQLNIVLRASEISIFESALNIVWADCIQFKHHLVFIWSNTCNFDRNSFEPYLSLIWYFPIGGYIVHPLFLSYQN